ncbi:hypothetical protein DICPUDRAFT_152320 [Dictyostelium purpureum]|uniref:Uncharacterized protein n=1 Tax=Dictyostelium purpureum TaxID=5786 RepID=F0ZL22_DICPU|nr:uncharacterized protein DICPUDRAFT_152320 [Dictyostelium purpureum]EGC35383.1 hypothetical protein DICPUDRAFT_152320 [Dictyostelium purpureum]|eukprot:XP_003288121.1 hypothetical protein DICPUDRAFT_152320 [Dictyostelium purpureum]
MSDNNNIIINNKDDHNSSDDEDFGLVGLIVEELETYKYKFYDDIKIEIKGQELQNVNVQPSTGLLPWPASRILSQFISKYNDQFKNKNVVELGSGVGLCGLVSSKYSNFTLFTDGDEKSLPLLQDNVEANKDLYKDSKNKPNVERLFWGKTDTLEKFKEQYQSKFEFDIVIGSDLIYVDDSIEPLFYTVDSILSKSQSNSPTFYLSFLDRKNHLPVLKSVSQKYNFTMESIELNFLNYEPSTMSKMFIFKRIYN